MNSNIIIKEGRYYPRQINMLGYIAIVFGLVSSIESIVTGTIIIVIGVFIGFSKAILEIDPELKRIRNYPYMLGLKLGKWSSIKEYTQIGILRKNVSEKTFGGRTNKSVTTHDIYYDITLLNENHRKKISVKRYTSKETAFAELEGFAQDLGVTKTTYNPVISQATKRRR